MTSTGDPSVRVRPGSVTGEFGTGPVPESIRDLTTLRDPDYWDLFTIGTRGLSIGSAEEWARALVEGAAGLGGQFVYRVLLGLRLAWRSSPEHVGGWKIERRGETWVRVEASSWLLTAQVIVQVDDDRVSVATLIHELRPVAALVWRLVSVGHREALPGLLRQAVKIREADKTAA